MPFIPTPGLNIHYELAGQGATALILVHGNFASWRWWRPVLDRLPPGVRAYAPDLRGCGDTDHPATGYTIPQLAADLHAFTAALHLPAFHLVGHSLGGAVALQFALDHPDRVQTLTLAAPAPAGGLPLLRAPDSSPMLLSLFDMRDVRADTFVRPYYAALDALYRFWHNLDANRPALRQALKRLMPTLNYDHAFEQLVADAAHMAPEAVVEHLRALAEWNVQPELGRLDVPTLIVGGGRDTLIPQAGLERTVGGLPHGRLVLWPDVGHAPHLEQPDRFAQILFAFIREQTPQSGWLAALWRRLRPDYPCNSTVTWLC